MNLLRRVWHLFVDSAWLAGAALAWVAACAACLKAGLGGRAASVMLLAGLGAALAVSVQAAARRR